MKNISVGVIGIGHLGKLHAKMFAQSKSADFAGVYDSNPVAALKTAEEYHTNSFNSIDDLLNEVDAVSIAATTSAHFEIAEKCILNGKHIFIEKPITATIEEGEKLVNLAKDKNIKIQVGHIERFNPALLSLEKYINNPLFIQTDRLAQFNPRGTDVAVVLDLMIHDIDIILSLVKSKVTQIDASGVAVVSNNVDIANARIAFENGAVANVTASRISQKKMRKMRIFQRDTYLSLDFITGTSEMYRIIPSHEQPSNQHISFGEIGNDENKKKIIYEQPEVKEVNALQYELELFIDAIKNDTTPIVTGEDGLKALQVADTILKSIDNSLKKIF